MIYEDFAILEKVAYGWVKVLDGEKSVLYLPSLKAVPLIADTYDTETDIFTQTVSDGIAIVSGTAVNTTNYTLAEDTGDFFVALDAGGTQSGVIGTDSASGDGTLYYQLATPIQTKQGLPQLQCFADGSINQLHQTRTITSNEEVITDNGSINASLTYSVPVNLKQSVSDVLVTTARQGDEIALLSDKVDAIFILGGW